MSKRGSKKCDVVNCHEVSSKQCSKFKGCIGSVCVKCWSRSHCCGKLSTCNEVDINKSNLNNATENKTVIDIADLGGAVEKLNDHKNEPPVALSDDSTIGDGNIAADQSNLIKVTDNKSSVVDEANVSETVEKLEENENEQPVALNDGSTICEDVTNSEKPVHNLDDEEVKRKENEILQADTVVGIEKSSSPNLEHSNTSSAEKEATNTTSQSQVFKVGDEVIYTAQDGSTIDTAKVLTVCTDDPEGAIYYEVQLISDKNVVKNTISSRLKSTNVPPVENCESVKSCKWDLIPAASGKTMRNQVFENQKKISRTSVISGSPAYEFIKSTTVVAAKAVWKGYTWHLLIFEKQNELIAAFGDVLEKRKAGEYIHFNIFCGVTFAAASNMAIAHVLEYRVDTSKDFKEICLWSSKVVSLSELFELYKSAEPEMFQNKQSLPAIKKEVAEYFDSWDESQLTALDASKFGGNVEQSGLSSTVPVVSSNDEEICDNQLPENEKKRIKSARSIKPVVRLEPEKPKPNNKKKAAASNNSQSSHSDTTPSGTTNKRHKSGGKKNTTLFSSDSFSFDYSGDFSSSSSPTYPFSVPNASTYTKPITSQSSDFTSMLSTLGSTISGTISSSIKSAFPTNFKLPSEKSDTDKLIERSEIEKASYYQARARESEMFTTQSQRQFDAQQLADQREQQRKDNNLTYRERSMDLDHKEQEFMLKLQNANPQYALDRHHARDIETKTLTTNMQVKLMETASNCNRLQANPTYFKSNHDATNDEDVSDSEEN